MNGDIIESPKCFNTLLTNEASVGKKAVFSTAKAVLSFINAYKHRVFRHK